MKTTVTIDWFTGVNHYAKTHPLPLSQNMATFVSCPGWSGYDVGQRELDTGLKRYSSTTRVDMGWAIVASATALRNLTSLHENHDLLEQMWGWGFREYRSSRLDLAIDIYDQGLLAQKVARSARRDVIKTVARRISVIESTRGGTGVTTYIGSRQAARFMRVYDKNAESNGKVPASRFELQANKEFADQLWKSIHNPKQEELNAVAFAAVNGLVTGWGDTSVDMALSFILDAKPLPKVDTGASEWEWLSRQVLPSLMRDYYLADSAQQTLIHKLIKSILGNNYERIIEFNDALRYMDKPDSE